jgi:CheY-like chemotaxis protein
MFSRETAGDQQRLALNARRAPFWLRKEVHLGPPARTKNATTLPITHASNPVLVGLGSVVAESRTMNAQTNPSRDVRIRVVVADDHPVIRRMVRSTLQQHPLEVCGEAENGAEAIEEVKRVRPDVVILNVTMPLVNGFEAAQEIKKQVPETAIVILSSHADKYFIAEAKKVGVRAYVPKSKIGQAFVDALEAALKGDDFIVLE